MGISNRCRGSDLLNHLRQTKVETNLDYVYSKTDQTWSGKLAVLGKTFSVSGKNSKKNVLMALIEEAEPHIRENI
jgi:hypothetical protein